jgi:cytochrome P450
VHFCLGAPLARMELAESVPALFETFPDLALTGEPESRGTFVLRGFRRVPVGGRHA